MYMYAKIFAEMHQQIMNWQTPKKSWEVWLFDKPTV